MFESPNKPNVMWCSHSVVFPVAYVLDGSPKMFMITETVYFRLSNGTYYTVEKGYRFDGATSPRLLWSFVPKISNAIVGITLHDHMYENDFLRDQLGDKKAKEFIDMEMKLWADKFAFSPADIKTSERMYWAVKYFGWKIFKRRKQQTKS